MSIYEELRRKYHDPNISDEQQDNIYNDMWQLYVNTHFPHISKVHPDAAWVDKNGNIATLHDNNGEAFPLTKENWYNITHGYTNFFSLDKEVYNRLVAYLHNQGFAHLDEIPQDTPKNQRGADFRMYSEPALIPPFFYSGNENYAPPRLIPNREIYDDAEFSV